MTYSASELPKQVLDFISMTYSGLLAVPSQYIGGKQDEWARICRQVQNNSYGYEVHVLVIELLFLLVLARTVGIIKCSTSTHHGAESGLAWSILYLFNKV